MPISRIKPRFAFRTIGRLTLGLALVCGLTPVSAEERSSPEDRRRFVSVTRNLEQAPLEAALRADREWALTWLTEAPDVTVIVCADALGGLAKSKYRYTGEIVLQNMFAMAAHAIERPETANDPNAQQLAGLEGALTAYRSILRDRPEARSSALDSLLERQARGELAAFAEKAWIDCSAKK